MLNTSISHLFASSITTSITTTFFDQMNEASAEQYLINTTHRRSHCTHLQHYFTPLFSDVSKGAIGIDQMQWIIRSIHRLEASMAYHAISLHREDNRRTNKESRRDQSHERKEKGHCEAGNLAAREEVVGHR